MNDKEIREGLLAYTQKAADLQDNLRRRLVQRLPTPRKKPVRMYIRRMSVALAALALVVSFFAFTPPGVALAQAFYDNIIQKLFPPKEITVNPEGLEEQVSHMPQGEIPAAEEDARSGFVIYVDESRYVMTRRENDYFIAQVPLEVMPGEEEASMRESLALEGLSAEEIDAAVSGEKARLEEFYNSLPPCRMTIAQKEGSTAEEEAQRQREALLQQYPDISEIAAVTSETHGVEGLALYAQSGTEWDSTILELYIVDNQKDGVFIITLEYFMEAAEGHGARFLEMLKTFQVLPDEPLPS